MWAKNSETVEADAHDVAATSPDAAKRLILTEPEVETAGTLLLMDKILHDPKDPKLWELWYIPYNG